MRAQPKTAITSARKVKTTAAVDAAPVLPRLRASATHAAIPPATPTRRKRRRTKKKE